LLPLFSGYLFFCGSEDQRVELLRTNRVANLIEVKDQGILVDEICQIEKALRAGVPLSHHSYLKAGTLCQVTAGPLTGLKGIVVRTKSAIRLVLQVDILGRATSVEIDADMIEVIEEQR
jgi:transcriptional antiterminator RfaH